MKKVVLLTFFVFYANSYAQKLEGQKLIDSLLVELPKMKEDTLKVNLLNKLAYTYKFNNPENTLKYANIALFLSKKINYKEGIGVSYLNIGIYHRTKDDLKNGKLNFYNGLKLCTKKKNLIQIYLGLFICYDFESNYPKALEFAYKGLKINEEIGDKRGVVKSYINISAIYLNLENYRKTIEINNKAIQLNKSLEIEVGSNVIYCNNGICYGELKEFDKAISSFNKAIEINLKTDNIGNLADCYDGLSGVYNQKGNDEKVIYYSNLAKKLNLESENRFDYAVNISQIGAAYLNMSKNEINKDLQKKLFEKAITNILEAIQINKELTSLDDLSVNYKNLSEVQKLLGNYKSSLESHEQYVIYKDSVFNADNKETIKNLEDKREIELRDNKLKINQLELKSKEKQKWYLLGGLGLLTVIGGLLFYQSRKRKQVNQKLETLNQNLDAKNLELDQANKAKTRFFGILNHDLRGPVANLVFFLQLQQESPEMLDAESIKRMQNKTMTGAENLLSTMEDILQWSKSQMENFKPQPKKIPVEQLFNDTKKVFSGYLKIDFEYQNPNNIEVFTDENYLKTIIRNLTSNAINVFTITENPKIIWKAWQENNVSYFSIQDNGPGANEDQFNALFEDSEITSAKSGLGLYLIRDMAKAINCEISVDSKIGEGTTFTLKF